MSIANSILRSIWKWSCKANILPIASPIGSGIWRVWLRSVKNTHCEPTITYITILRKNAPSVSGTCFCAFLLVFVLAINVIVALFYVTAIFDDIKDFMKLGMHWARQCLYRKPRNFIYFMWLTVFNSFRINFHGVK